jgi:hypothetical protein
MELDLVDAAAEAVGGAEHRFVLVGQVPVLAGLGRAGQPAHGCQRGADVVSVVAAERVDGVEERLISGSDVVVDQRHRLVARCTLQRIHVATVWPWRWNR